MRKVLAIPLLILILAVATIATTASPIEVEAGNGAVVYKKARTTVLAYNPCNGEEILFTRATYKVLSHETDAGRRYFGRLSAQNGAGDQGGEYVLRSKGKSRVQFEASGSYEVDSASKFRLVNKGSGENWRTKGFFHYTVVDGRIGDMDSSYKFKCK